jgi:hypothetical protein
MKSRVLPLLAATALGFAASAAAAQEVVQSGETGAPPSAHAPNAPPAQVGDPDQSPEAIGAWARGVMAGRPSSDPELAAAPGAKPPRCQPPPDKKPHGEVWAGAGTGGYREAGGVVTMPVGDCGQVTLAIDKTEFAGPHRR